MNAIVEKDLPVVQDAVPQPGAVTPMQLVSMAVQQGAEEWRHIAGFESLYSVSSLGRVRSEAQLVIRRTGNYRMKQRILRPGAGVKSKYLSVGLGPKAKRETHYVHELVLTAFKGPRPGGEESCHKDGNRQNNRTENLRWGTRKENHADKNLHGTSPQGERHPMAKLDDKRVRVMRRLHELGIAPALSMQYFKVSRMTHWRVVNRKLWRHVV